MLPIPVITGLGLVTPLGRNVDETWNGLLAGRFINNHYRAPGGWDRVHDLAVQAAGEALSQSKLGDGTALVVGTSKGAVESWMTTPPESSQLASVAARIRATFPSLDGPSLTISAACASGLHALIRAAMLIRGGEANRVLVVAAEASVHPMFLASFRRLGVLPREGVGCHPFDENRDGFLMSEAAAAVLVERAESSGAQPWAKVERFGIGGDATHMTGGDPQGETLRRLLRHVIDGRDVDLVHAHATGTSFHDPLELAAFEDECPANPAVYSHKGALGHSLGAAGLVSVVLNCLMHRRGVVLPNVQTRSPLPTRRVILSDKIVERPIHRSVAVASGFGGAVGVVSLTSP